MSFEGLWDAGVLPNVDFLLQTRELILSYYFGKAKNLKVVFEHFEGKDKKIIDATGEMQAYFSFLTEVIDRPLKRVEQEVGVGEGYIKNLLQDDDSYLIIKLHLIIQSLLWTYIQIKIKRLPRQYENWSFNQIVDLADAFDEIPSKIIAYCNCLNVLRNNVAHKPFAFKFENIKSKYSGALYTKEGPLSCCSKRPDSDVDVFKDWKSTFLVSIIVLGFLIKQKELDVARKDDGWFEVSVT
ncbi:hypothetical protein [Geomonas edaphica]|uniref:hypothetical protein n=1 Tax=Geomonas edaphica TaxID=2570226 RepID=UPI0010A79018|nr:hypothetical protein [Geomonas edaphica]